MKPTQPRTAPQPLHRHADCLVIARRMCGHSQALCAAHLSTTATTISRWEHGQSRPKGIMRTNAYNYCRAAGQEPDTSTSYPLAAPPAAPLPPNTPRTAATSPAPRADQSPARRTKRHHHA